MAIDEAMLRARIAGTVPATVRFYGWASPTVSLGYGQPLDGTVDRSACHRLGVGLVRRPTGGSAILHETPAGELTYAVVARRGDFPGSDDVLETYRVLGEGLREGLRRLGVDAELVPLARARRAGSTPTFCFARVGAYELAVDGRKLVGSAQRRQGGAFLQHGSLLLDADPERLRAVFPGLDPGAGLATLGAALGRVPAFDELVEALTAGLAQRLARPLPPGGLEPREAEDVERLVWGKYGREDWTLRGVDREPGSAAAAGLSPAPSLATADPGRPPV
jgi:lipoate-protein ligase A